MGRSIKGFGNTLNKGYSIKRGMSNNLQRGMSNNLRKSISGYSIPDIYQVDPYDSDDY